MKSIEEKLKFIKRKIVTLQKIVKEINTEFPHRPFTLDGRLVGDLGEIIAETVYDLKLNKGVTPYHDAMSRERNVQIKATFKKSLTFSHVPEYYLGLKLYPDGSFEEIFNGPGKVIRDRYAKRKGIGKQLLSFPIKVLGGLSGEVKASDRIKKRRGVKLNNT